MRARLFVGGFSLVAASLGLAGTPANACDDDCDCGYHGYAAPAYAHYGGYGYYGRPAYAYYTGPAYAAPVYYPVPAYYAAPAYYAPRVYYSPGYGYPYGRPYYGWRGGYVDAGPVRHKGNIIARRADPRAAYALNHAGRQLGKAPPQLDPRAAYANHGGRQVSKVPPAIGPTQVDRARKPQDARLPRAFKQPPPAPTKRPVETAGRREAGGLVQVSSSGPIAPVRQIAPVRRQDR